MWKYAIAIKKGALQIAKYFAPITQKIALTTRLITAFAEVARLRRYIERRSKCLIVMLAVPK